MAFRKSVNLFTKYLPSCSNLSRTYIPTNSLRCWGPRQIQSGPQQCEPAIGLSHPRLTFNVPPQRSFHILRQLTPEITGKLLTSPEHVVSSESKRTMILFSRQKGKRKTVKAVVLRFKRLDWGIWIRPKSNRGNYIWRKGWRQLKRSRTHVFCGATQSYQLDKMVTRFWWRKKFHVDDPYENYQRRPNFWATKRKP